MSKSNISPVFIMGCIAVLIASYGVGNVIKTVRFNSAADGNTTISESNSLSVSAQESADTSEPQNMASGRDRGFSSQTADETQTPGGRGIGGGGGTINSNLGVTSVDNSGGGVLLESVEESGRGSRFGLQQGDIVLSINSQKIENSESFDTLMNNIARGAAVAIIVIRNGAETTVGREATTGGGAGGGRGGMGGGNMGGGATF